MNIKCTDIKVGPNLIVLWVKVMSQIAVNRWLGKLKWLKLLQHVNVDFLALVH